MGIDFGVIWAADFNNTIIFIVCHPARRPRVAPPPAVTPKLKEDDRYIVMGIDCVTAGGGSPFHARLVGGPES